MRKLKASIAIGLLAPIAILAQLPGIGGPIPVYDNAAWLRLVQEGIQLGNIVTSSTHQELWMAQVFVSKIPWITAYLQNPQNTSVQNTIGEMATYGQTLATGTNAPLSWHNAIAQIAALGPLVQQQQIGSTPIAQLATVEAINGAGANNLAIIGNARGYLANNLPAMQSLSRQIQSPNSADNGPTQQMQMIAAATAQNNTTAVQNLQVNTGVLETTTAIAKNIGDQQTTDLNMQIKQQQTYLTEPTGVGGWAQDFVNHP